MITEDYTDLFALLSQLMHCIRTIPGTEEQEGPMIFAEKIFSETDTIYRKEKLVIFPFVRGLRAADKRSDSCAPFKNVKKHYTAILAIIHSFKTEQGDLFQDRPVATLLNEFERKLISLQIVKDRYLFNPLRSCTGCSRIN